MKFQITYKFKETGRKNGDIEHEVTVNDGRHDGEDLEELTKLRQILLDNAKELSKLYLENTKRFNEGTER